MSQWRSMRMEPYRSDDAVGHHWTDQTTAMGWWDAMRGLQEGMCRVSAPCRAERLFRQYRLPTASSRSFFLCRTFERRRLERHELLDHSQVV